MYLRDGTRLLPAAIKASRRTQSTADVILPAVGPTLWFDPLFVARHRAGRGRPHPAAMAPSARDAADAFVLAVADAASQHARGDALDALAAAARLQGAVRSTAARARQGPRNARPRESHARDPALAAR